MRVGTRSAGTHHGSLSLRSRLCRLHWPPSARRPLFAPEQPCWPAQRQLLAARCWAPLPITAPANPNKQSGAAAPAAAAAGRRDAWTVPELCSRTSHQTSHPSPVPSPPVGIVGQRTQVNRHQSGGGGEGLGQKRTPVAGSNTQRVLKQMRGFNPRTGHHGRFGRASLLELQKNNFDICY